MSLSTRLKRRVKGLVFGVLEGLGPLFQGAQRPLAADVRKILVMEGGGIGDLIWVLPAMEALRANFPYASIALLASPSSVPVLELYPQRDIIDEVIEYEPRGRHRGFYAKMRLVGNLRRRGFDLIYAPGRGEGMREEMVMTFLMGAPARLGFSTGRTGFLHTCRTELNDGEPMMVQNLNILKSAGLIIPREAFSKGVDLKVPESVAGLVREMLRAWGVEGNGGFLVIHPGASWNAALKCWPLEQYVDLMEALAREDGRKMVVIGGPGEEAVSGAIERAFGRGGAVINVVGRTSIAEMGALIGLSDLFIGNDSGPLHLAQALGIPSVAIFGLTSPEQVIWRSDLCRIVRPASARPLYLHQYDYSVSGDEARAVLERISVEDVLKAIREAAPQRAGT